MTRNSTQQSLRLLFRSSLCLALAGFSTISTTAEARPRSGFNRSVESEHQPVVSYTSYAYDIQVGGGSLSPTEAQRLEGWLASIGIGYGDRISVGSDAAYYGPGIRDDIANLVARHGLLIEDDAALAAGAAPEGAVRLVVRRASASVPGCPNWSDTQETNGMGNTSRNYGCAINGNLAAMVANPEDLVRGQGGDSALRTATSNRAIQVYRDKVPTGSAELKTITAGGN